MSASAIAKSNHIHLPSVHLRDDGGSGFDYEENLYVTGKGQQRRVARIVRLAVIERGEELLVRETRDVLCAEEAANLKRHLAILMDEGHPEAQAFMEECARREFARQLRISAGLEQACARCGCSETRSCSGGCCWATMTLCSRCVIALDYETVLREGEKRR